MNPMTFDQISKIFAQRRLSRRQALQKLGAAGVAAGLIGLAGREAGAAAAVPPGPADAAQLPVTIYRSETTGALAVATPAVTEAAKPTTFMFVQSFATGSLVPQPGQNGKSGKYTLTLPHGLGETIYFSDRPERLVGTVPTPAFLKGLGFPDNNPPNAVLIGHQSPTHQDLVVLELFNPRYDTKTNTATYEAQVLKDTHSVDMEFTETPDEEAGDARNYTAAHLFIDDCPDQTQCCYLPGQFPSGSPVGGITTGYCWDPNTWHCNACRDYSAVCNSTYPQCNGRCQARFTGGVCF